MESPEIIYFNGDVHTLDAEDHVYEAIAVKNGKISAVGTNESILKLRKDETTFIDLHQKTVIPSFIDAHIHLFALGFNLSYVNCQLDSIEEVVQAIQERANEVNDENEWIIGWGFDESKYPENRKLTKWDLEGINNPVYITRYCLHEAVINEAAIQRAGISKEIEIEGGIIECTKNGEMTGLLVEKAMDLVETVLPPYTYENMREAITLANKHLLRYGITSVHDAGLGFLIDPFKEFEVLKEMSEAGDLQIKMYLMVLAKYYEEFYQKYANEETDHVKIGSLKIFADGTLSGETAALFEPYLHSEEIGMLHYSDEEMLKMMTVAYDINKQVAVHAIGDRAVDQVLRMYESLERTYPNKDHRPRIEHTTVSNDDIRERMYKINAIPVPQPTLINAAGDMYVHNVENERLHQVFAIRSHMEQGLKPAGSSDAPVVDCSPFLGISAAMERKTIQGVTIGEDQHISLKDAIRMYTNFAAYAAFEEEEKGSIEKGKVADLVVLPKGFMNYSAEEVRKTEVEMTIVNGRIVYDKKRMNETILQKG